MKCLRAARALGGNSRLLEKYWPVPKGEAVMCPACSADTVRLAVCKHFQPWWWRGCSTVSDINCTVNKYGDRNSVFIALLSSVQLFVSVLLHQ